MYAFCFVLSISQSVRRVRGARYQAQVVHLHPPPPAERDDESPTSQRKRECIMPPCAHTHALLQGSALPGLLHFSVLSVSGDNDDEKKRARLCEKNKTTTRISRTENVLEGLSKQHSSWPDHGAPCYTHTHTHSDRRSVFIKGNAEVDGSH